MDLVNINNMIAEISKRHGITFKPDDPAFALITINELLVEDTIVKLKQIETERQIAFERKIKDFENKIQKLVDENRIERDKLIELAHILKDCTNTTTIPTTPLPTKQEQKDLKNIFVNGISFSICFLIGVLIGILLA